MTEDEMKMQLDKLYWVNKELINQIKERDVNNSKLRDDFELLKMEDLNKNKQLDELDAQKRDRSIEKEIFLTSKRELAGLV